MYQFKFTAEWGTWTGYFAEKYLAHYDFSGRVQIEGGKITNVEKILFPRDAWGPFIFSKQFIEYGKTEWQSHIHNNFDGIRVTAQVEDNTAVHIITNMGCVRFTPAELKGQGHIVQHVGEQYSMAVIHIEPDDPQWRFAELLPGEVRINGTDIAGKRADFWGIKGLTLPPQTQAHTGFTLPLEPVANTYDRSVVRCCLRFLISESPDEEKHARGLPNFSLLINGRQVYQNKKFCTYHDTNSQFLEEVWFTLPQEAFSSPQNELKIINSDESFTVFIQMLRLIPSVQRHMQITSCPKWVLVGVPFCISLNCTQGAAKMRLEYDSSVFEMAMPETDIHTRHQTSRGKSCPIPENDEFIWEGEHEFFFKAKKPFQNGIIRFTDEWSSISSCAIVGECWAGTQEPDKMKTGVEIKTGTPWEYEDFIKLIRDKQLGNLVVFRDYHNRFTHYQKLWEAAADCRKYGFYTDAICMKDQDIIASASADRCQCVGGHECTGIFYGAHQPQNLSRSMREAQDVSVNILRMVATGYRIPGVPVATGDASGGSRYAYMAGFDVLRHETFVGHHMLILPNARGSAKAFKKKIWGTHAATQHNAQPELDDGLRRFWLGFYLPWVFGANFVFEEDSLFNCFKYYRMASDDYLPRHKSEICAAFHKYTQTHPRLGSPQVDIAILQGRFAAPFSGISTANSDEESQDESLINENFPVWGMAGCQSYEWGHRQPEKGFHLLETLAPGICLNPLNQDAKKVRRFFSGDPRGEFDFLPVEADTKTFAGYQLILLLNWHTMELQTEQQCETYSNDYEHFMRYAELGGTVFLAVPHLTTRADRTFLADMDDLKLIYGGDVADLCGVRILGKSTDSFSEAIGTADFAKLDLNRQTDMLRLPNASADEDGACMLADIEAVTAETVVTDKRSGRPLVVRNRVGRGYVYLLCVYAYPGHEALKDFMPNLISALIDRHVVRDVTVLDPSQDVYWSVWKVNQTSGKLYLLNTDWTSCDNSRTVTVTAGGNTFACEVSEGAVREISFTENFALYTRDCSANLTLQEQDRSCTKYRLTGFGSTVLYIWAGKDAALSIGGVEHRLHASQKLYEFEIDFDGLGEHDIPLAFHTILNGNTDYKKR